VQSTQKYAEKYQRPRILIISNAYANL